MAGWRPGRRHDSTSPLPLEPTSHFVDDEPDRRRGCLLPLGALLLGLVAGGGGVGLVMSNRESPPPPVVTVAPTPTSSGDLTSVNVPRACLDIADEARILQRLLDSSVQAARDLDAAELSRLVRQIDEQQTALQAHAQVCRRGMETPVPGVTGTERSSQAPTPATSNRARSVSPTASSASPTASRSR